MVKRLLLGLLKGLLIGGTLALLLVKGLGIGLFSAWLAYPMAILTGVLAGLLVGKPIWAPGAKVEAGLKAGFGALLAAGAMFALRRWATIEVDWSALEAGRGALGQLPAFTLPAIATALAVLFDIDNSGDDAEDDSSASRKRIAEADGDGKARVAALDESEDLEELSAQPRRARR